MAAHNEVERDATRQGTSGTRRRRVREQVLAAIGPLKGHTELRHNAQSRTHACSTRFASSREGRGSAAQNDKTNVATTPLHALLLRFQVQHEQRLALGVRAFLEQSHRHGCSNERPRSPLATLRAIGPAAAPAAAAREDPVQWERASQEIIEIGRETKSEGSFLQVLSLLYCF